jgi:hypothetical protein
MFGKTHMDGEVADPPVARDRPRKLVPIAPSKNSAASRPVIAVRSSRPHSGIAARSASITAASWPRQRGYRAT